MSRIHIVSFSDREELHRYTWPRLRAYAEKHGYATSLFTQSDQKERHPSWNKILTLLNVLKSTEAEYIVWMDDDILITKPEKSLVSFINEFGFAESEAIVMMCEDVPGELSTLMNAGVGIFKRGDATEKMLQTIWWLGSQMPLQLKGFSYEQEVFNWYYKFARRSDIKLIPHGTMQSIARPGGVWKSGDFAAHVTAGEVPLRVEILQRLLRE